jgi:hypothetical protein
LAGIDLLTGKVHASVEDWHHSRELVGFLRKIDAAYRADTAIKLILDNHSAHISKETKAWLVTTPQGRSSFVFTPKHRSWLNLVEGLFRTGHSAGTLTAKRQLKMTPQQSAYTACSSGGTSSSIVVRRMSRTAVSG